MRILHLAGDHYAMGWQHGRQVHDLRDPILQAMKKRLAVLERLPIDTRPHLAEITAAWEEFNRPTLAMMRGISAGLELDWEFFLRYTLSSYLADRALRPIPGQGCTAWGAAGPLTRDAAPILAKNRDYRPEHRKLQCVVHARPQRGYAYTYLTSGGSPGVFSSGMNEKGLAVADTHVTSQETGPGLARYSVMMALLESCSRVREACDYLRSFPHLGDGTLTLADADGELAVFEAGHSTQGVIHAEQGYVVATNHYVTPGLEAQSVDTSPPELRGNTLKRYTAVSSALHNSSGSVDIPWARRLMASHSSPQEAICRHRQYEPYSVTISTVLFLPGTRTLLLAGGLPCRTKFQSLQVNDWSSPQAHSPSPPWDPFFSPSPLVRVL